MICFSMLSSISFSHRGCLSALEIKRTTGAVSSVASKTGSSFLNNPSFIIPSIIFVYIRCIPSS